jgi:chromosome segregation ATPase
MDEARRQASILAGQAKLDATKHADELAAKLESAQAQEAAETAKVAASVTAVSGDLSKVKDDANSTKNRVGEVSTDLAGVKTDAAATKAELEKTISDLKSTRGDLGVQSGLIATNGKELAALRALGERNYTEFRLTKEKTPRKVGDVQMRLKAADMKKNRYTIELIADDKLVEKKDKTINEPVQFMLSRATQPFEIVVNEVKKDMISGYLSAPKVQQTRN